MNRSFLIAALLVSAPVFAQQESPGKRVGVHGMQMYYEVSGQGDPLIVLQAAIPRMTVEMIVAMPFAAEYRKLAPNPEGFPAWPRS